MLLISDDSHRSGCCFNLTTRPVSRKVKSRERTGSFVLLPCSSPAALLK
jgi:hypothetical protein